MLGELKVTWIYMWFFHTHGVGLSITQSTVGLIVNAYLAPGHRAFVRPKHMSTPTYVKSLDPMSKARA